MDAYKAKQDILSSQKGTAKKAWPDETAGDRWRAVVDERNADDCNGAKTPLTSGAEDKDLRERGEIRSERSLTDRRTSRRRDDLIRDFDRTFGFTPPEKNRSTQPFQGRKVIDLDSSDLRRHALDETYAITAALEPGRQSGDSPEAREETPSNNYDSMSRHSRKREGGDGSVEQAAVPETMLAWRMIDDTDMENAYAPVAGIPQESKQPGQGNATSPSSFNRRSSLKFLPSPPSSSPSESPRPGESSAQDDQDAQPEMKGESGGSLYAKSVLPDEAEDDIDIWEKALVILVVFGRRPHQVSMRSFHMSCSLRTLARRRSGRQVFCWRI